MESLYAKAIVEERNALSPAPSLYTQMNEYRFMYRLTEEEGIRRRRRREAFGFVGWPCCLKSMRRHRDTPLDY